MSTDIDIELVKDNYARMSDEELVHIASKDAAGMRPDAQQVIKDELKKINLDSNLVKGVEIQNRQVTNVDAETLSEMIRSLECPICGKDGHKLNATITNQVFSFIIITNRTKKLVIACPDCLDKANNNAILTTSLFGWWGFPWGIIRSIQAIIDNMVSKRNNRLDQANEQLKKFTLSNIGQVEIYKDNKEMLKKLITAK
jgi:hypothetical protein